MAEKIPVPESEKPQLSKSLKEETATSDDEEISLMEFYERSRKGMLMSKTRLSKRSKKKTNSTLIWSPSVITKRDERKKKNKTKIMEPILTKVEEDEDKGKGKKDLPVFELASDYYFRGVESDEELLLDDERGEIDKGYKYVIDENELTYTRVKVPIKIYFKNSGCSVLYWKDYPVPTLAKLALARYNHIERTNYQYVGLVKAYAVPVGVFNYTVRFQARLPDQRPIYFQAIIFEGYPNSENEVPIEIILVHPLP